MSTLKVIVLILDLLCAIALTATILFQSGKSAGLSGAIAGGSDSFMARGGSKTLDAKLASLTKWIGLAFVILSLFAVILVRATAKTGTAAESNVPETTAVITTTDAPATETLETEAATAEAPSTEAPETEG